MYFRVLDHGVRPAADARDRAYLLTDNWDDWFKYNTMYTLVVYDEERERHTVGSVKISQFEMEEGRRRAAIPRDFDALDDRFFSLGQDDSYYETLNALGPERRDRILQALKDVALDTELFQRALDEKVTGVSLLRAVTPTSVQGQFYRMARGGAGLSSYNFSYTAPKPSRSRIDPVSLDFKVEPESQPPTNIHVLVGRNGVGKTRLLDGMTRALVGAESEEENVGSFESATDDLIDEQLFANLVSVTFSAFDPFGPLPNRQDKSSGVQYAYIGLRRTGLGDDGRPHPPRTPDQLSSVFGRSVWLCRQGARVSRWRRALEMLEADPIFKDAEVASLAGDDLPEKEFRVETQLTMLRFNGLVNRIGGQQMRANLFWFSDGQWARIEPFIPSNRRGVKPKNNRRILSGIMHVLKSGCRWVDCPPEYGPAKTVYNRFNRWSAQRIWQSIFEAVAEPAEPPERMALDSTHIKAHRCAGGGNVWPAPSVRGSCRLV